MHRESKKEKKMQNNKFSKPDIIRGEEMKKEPTQSTLHTNKAP